MKNALKMNTIILICIMIAACGSNINAAENSTPTSTIGAPPKAEETPITNIPTPNPILEFTPEPTPEPTPKPTPRLSMDEKWKALNAIVDEKSGTSSAEKRDELQQKWLDLVFTMPEGTQDMTLDGYDTLCLSHLSILLSFMPNFVWTDDLKCLGDNLIGVIEFYYHNYYYEDTYALSYIADWYDYTIPGIMYDRLDSSMYYSIIVEAETANHFFQSLIGVDFPEDYGDCYDEWDEAYIRKGGAFSFEGGGDTYVPVYYVSGYKYLGGSLFLVILDADLCMMPGDIDDAFIPDAAIMLVQRDDSLWGFTVISKLKGYFSGDMGLPALDDIDWVRVERVEVP